MARTCHDAARDAENTHDHQRGIADPHEGGGQSRDTSQAPLGLLLIMSSLVAHDLDELAPLLGDRHHGKEIARHEPAAAKRDRQLVAFLNCVYDSMCLIGEGGIAGSLETEPQ